jgi:hypothetical protein
MPIIERARLSLVITGSITAWDLDGVHGIRRLRDLGGFSPTEVAPCPNRLEIRSLDAFGIIDAGCGTLDR